MLRSRLAVLAAALLVTSARAADDARFSQALNAPERTSIGLARLSSDQLGVLDALVRRDTAAQGGTTLDPKTPRVFSQRLTEDERRNAGLGLLGADEIARLDVLVERHASARLARTLLAPPAYLAASPRARVTESAAPKSGEVHGAFSLGYGWGKGGYSEKTGSMMLYYEDPEHRFSVSVGYSESHVKGPAVYRDYGLEPPRPLPEGP